MPTAEVAELLDLIAAQDPNPALRVSTQEWAASGDTRYVPMRLEIESVVVADSTGAEAVGVSTLLGRSPTVLRHGVVLAAAHGVRPP